MTKRLALADAVHHAREALDGGEPVVALTVLDSVDDGILPGERMSVWADRAAGTLGHANID